MHIQLACVQIQELDDCRHASDLLSSTVVQLAGVRICASNFTQNALLGWNHPNAVYTGYAPL